MYKFKGNKHKLSHKIYNKCRHLFKITVVPTQVVYFDEMRVGKSKEKVAGNLQHKSEKISQQRN